MKSLSFLLLFIASSEFCNSLANAVKSSFKDKSRRVDQFWLPKSPRNGHARRPARPYNYAYHHRSADDDSDSSMPMSMSPPSSSMPGMSDSSSDTSGNEKPKKLQVPQINFYNTIPNAIGFIGQGFLWLREIAAAMGTPLPLWIGCIPLFLIGIGLIFLPDLTTLGLPLFYPAGAEGDPLAAFPPLPEITIPDIGSSSFLQQLLPPKLISMRNG